MTRIAIVDYGMGNIGSVANALDRLGVTPVVASTGAAIVPADAIILPGVGAFHAAMGNLRRSGLDRTLTEEVVSKGKPFLGICLGMQLLARESTEQGLTSGLGWIDGRVVRLDPAASLPVPHAGWNEVQLGPPSPLFGRIEPSAHFYFDHSYHLECGRSITTATMNYGGVWCAAIQQGHILGVQFHPEKSQRNGLRLLRNFVTYVQKRKGESC
ncbi:MAG TPA: imidazole glycerol phosphate synthase subunit HisH [Opitutaceae bacterium]|nr:imidazole glycerol phosphate synthase subunit HisH [Opitutaceae bacterium]